MFYMTSILGNYDVKSLFKVTDDICTRFFVNGTELLDYNYRFIVLIAVELYALFLSAIPTEMSMELELGEYGVHS